jgi:membrane associated rhomboid family serine protease
MLPLKDDIKSRTRPFVTYLILGVNIMVFIFELSLGNGLNDFISRYGAMPFYIFHPQGILTYTTLFTSMFIHANFMHILGNMLFLWIFGDNVEDKIGHITYAFFYVLCGISGAMAHSILTPNSTIPMVGASGAISGVLGAYILFYPKARVLALIPLGFFIRVMRLPAIAFIGFWFAFQLVFALVSMGTSGGGVAYFAHVGGFAMGLLLALPFKLKKQKRYEYSIF